MGVDDVDDEVDVGVGVLVVEDLGQPRLHLASSVGIGIESTQPTHPANHTPAIPFERSTAQHSTAQHNNAALTHVSSKGVWSMSKAVRRLSPSSRTVTKP